MALQRGQQLGHYRIESKLGEGGMGEVWAATDTRLNRPAAIKALPAAVAADPARLARFQREAQLLAALNHPNIGAIYGVEEADGAMYLALELVEGDDLTERIEGRRVPLDEALEIALQIAAALAEAHDKGIVHRDLKPANIKLTPDGKVKVLDFGLAKALSDDPNASFSDPSLTTSPTLTTAGTIAGTLLGTAGYMSPEQARGKPVDRRADVWAFGVILFEMLTGDRLFPGETVTDIIAAIVTREPEWDRLPLDTPANVRRVLKRCLHKDARKRMRDIGDAALELQEEAEESPGAVPAEPVAAAPARSGRGWVLGIGGLVVGIVLTFAFLQGDRGPASGETTWSNLTPPAGVEIDYTAFLEISPDGRRVAFVAPEEPGGENMLWVRELGSENVRMLEGTTGAWQPFWSPDSQTIAYFAKRKLRRISVEGGVSQAIADTGNDPRGGSWGADGTILFVPDWSEPVFRVNASGGNAEQATTMNQERKELSHRWPHLLPDGKHFLYFAVSTYPEINPDNPAETDLSGLYVTSLDGADPNLLLTARSRAIYQDGFLMYVDDKILMTRPFDLESLSFTGEPVSIANNVTQSVGALWGGALFSLSDNGSLLFVRGAREERDLSQLLWRDRGGELIGKIGEPQSYSSVDLSNDGTRAAVTIGDPGDLWIFDLERGTSTRFTFDAGEDGDPIWSPDDETIIFRSTRVLENGEFTPASLFRKETSGLKPEEFLLAVEIFGPTIYTNDWSPDGEHIVTTAAQQGTGVDLLVFSLETSEFTTFLKTENSEQAGKFSPDGNFMAYESDESGRPEIYVRAFPGPGGKWQVSDNGGSLPIWRPDGRELFYVSIDGKLMSVNVDTEAGFRHDTPVALFEFNGWVPPDGRQTYDVSPDGRSFLLLGELESDVKQEEVVTLVTGWK